MRHGCGSSSLKTESHSIRGSLQAIKGKDLLRILTSYKVFKTRQ